MSPRLTNDEIETIRTLFFKNFSKMDHLWVFGSRVDLTKRGGDIDLYIEVDVFEFKDVYKKRSDFWIDLQDSLGEQKIDIVVRDPKKELDMYKIIKLTGIQIV